MNSFPLKAFFLLGVLFSSLIILMLYLSLPLISSTDLAYLSITIFILNFCFTLLVYKIIQNPVSKIVTHVNQMVEEFELKEPIDLSQLKVKEFQSLAVSINALSSRLADFETHRQQFVANVSHELRTPLTSIQGYVETLMNPAVTDKEQRKQFHETIYRHANRLNAIINDLLSLSRIERDAKGGQVALYKESVQKTVEAAIELCQVGASQRDISLSFDCPQDFIVKMDSALLNQALVNLIENSIKYSEKQTSVMVRIRQVEAEVLIEVIDEGIGIPEKHLDHLFERFYRVDKARSRNLGGTGLGLSIVKHIVLSLNGRISVDSQVDKGSTFSIWLPL